METFESDRAKAKRPLLIFHLAREGDEIAIRFETSADAPRRGADEIRLPSVTLADMVAWRQKRFQKDPANLPIGIPLTGRDNQFDSDDLFDQLLCRIDIDEDANDIFHNHLEGFLAPLGPTPQVMLVYGDGVDIFRRIPIPEIDRLAALDTLTVYPMSIVQDDGGVVLLTMGAANLVAARIEPDVNKLAAASIIANQKVLFLRRLADAREESGLPDDESLDYLRLTQLLAGIHIRQEFRGGADCSTLREAWKFAEPRYFYETWFWLQAERFPVHPLAQPDAEQRAMNVYLEPNQDYQLVRGEQRHFVTVLDAFSRMLPLVDPSYVKNPHSLQHNVPLIEAGIPRWLPAEIADRLTLDAKFYEDEVPHIIYTAQLSTKQLELLEMIVDHFNPQGVDISNHDNDNRLHGGQYEPIKIPVHPKTEMTGHEQMEAIEILMTFLTEALQCSAQEAERILKEIV